MRQLLFHFHGWSAKFDEWFDEGSDKLASASSPKNNFHDWGDAPNHIEADDFVASKILKKRVRRGEDQYLVEWETPDYDDRTWEPLENIHDPSLLADFEAARTRSSRRSPAGPYVLNFVQTDPVSAAAAALFAQEFVDEIGRKGARLLSRQQEEVASRKFFDISPCPPHLFKAMYDIICAMADELPGAASSPTLLST